MALKVVGSCSKPGVTRYQSALNYKQTWYDKWLERNYLSFPELYTPLKRHIQYDKLCNLYNNYIQRNRGSSFIDDTIHNIEWRFNTFMWSCWIGKLKEIYFISKCIFIFLFKSKQKCWPIYIYLLPLNICKYHKSKVHFV